MHSPGKGAKQRLANVLDAGLRCLELHHLKSVPYRLVPVQHRLHSQNTRPSTEPIHIWEAEAYVIFSRAQSERSRMQVSIGQHQQLPGRPTNLRLPTNDDASPGANSPGLLDPLQSS